MKDTIALELSFVNSNLQLLKEKLSELNSSVEVYQHERFVRVLKINIFQGMNIIFFSDFVT